MQGEGGARTASAAEGGGSAAESIQGQCADGRDERPSIAAQSSYGQPVPSSSVSSSASISSATAAPPEPTAAAATTTVPADGHLPIEYHFWPGLRLVLQQGR